MKAFIFDLYNTLLDTCTDEHRAETWRPVAEDLKARGVEVDPDTLIRSYDEAWDKHLASLCARSEYAFPEGDILCVYKAIAAEFGVELTDEQAAKWAVEVRRASVVRMRLFDGIPELLSGLKARGCAIYLLSNAQSVFTRGEIDGYLPVHMFDGILMSSDCGCRKPDPAFFGMLFDKYGLDKHSAVMVGDDPINDGEGAATFGIKFVLADGGAAAHSEELLKLAEIL